MNDYGTGTPSGWSTPDGSRPTSASGTGRLSTSQSPNRMSGRPLGAARLLEHCVTFYSTFNEDQMTLDTHADNSISTCKIYNTFDDTFLRQVLYGTVRYRALITTLMDTFYHHHGGSASREDINLYRVYAYLTIFRLEELTFPQYKRLVDANDPQKMLVFLKFLFDPAILKEDVRDNWLKIYDKEFVDATIARLLGFSSDVSELLELLGQRVFYTKKKVEDGESALLGIAAPRRTTSPAPFNLTEQKPKPLPVEEPLPPPMRARPAPIMKQGPTKEELAIQAAKEVHRKQVEAKFDPKYCFRLKSTERPSNLDKIRAEVEAERAQQSTFRAPKAVPAPPPPLAPVKLNTAAILREDAVYRRKQQEEADALRRYEYELRDSSTFNSWQTTQLEADAKARAASIERRRQEMADSHEAAIRARQQQVDDNHDLGRQLKAEAKVIEESLAREREELLRSNQQRREVIVEGRGAVAVAQEKAALDRRSAAEEERRRQAENARAVAEATARDLAEAKDLIMQLRALEKVPRQRNGDFDPTAMPDYGLLDGMSLVELRDRLAAAQQRRKEEEERQRSRILSAKQEKEAMLMSKAANISRVRTVQAAQSAARRTSATSAAAAAADQARVRHEQDVLQLAGKLDVKRAVKADERARVAAEEKKTRFEQMQQAAGASAVEENKFKELRSGAQREVKEKQSRGLVEATAHEATKARAQAVRMRNVKNDIKEKGDFVKAYDEKIRQLTLARAAEQAGTLSYKQQLTATQRTFEAGLSAKTTATAYAPFAGGQTGMMNRLAAIGRGELAEESAGGH